MGGRYLAASMKITYFDKAGVRRALDQWVLQLAEEHPELERVILFGTLASGIPVPGSDVDIALVLKELPVPFRDRIPSCLPLGFPVGVDVFPYTTEEFDTMGAESNPFIKGVLKKGIELYRRET